jgi:RNA polymerase sigma factor (sigma-70 family)
MQEDGATDAELWLSCRRGGLDALGQLFERHHSRVYRYCLRRVFVADDAEDCLSDTYLEAWRARRSFEVRDSALPVLLAVAKRVVQKRQRSDVRRQRLAQRHAGLRPPEVGDVAGDVEQALITAERLAWLAEATRSLAEADRDVYDLVINAEMSHEDAARILSIPVGTVKSRLHRVRRQIKSAAARDHEEVQTRCPT